MTRPDAYPSDIPPRSLGALLTELRLARGWSQLRVAEQLCAASGVPTVSRHEISRWERQRRVPGDFWLGWLAAVLEVPVGALAAAAATTRLGAARFGTTRPGAAQFGAAQFGAAQFGAARAGTGDRPATDPGAARVRQELLASAHAWLADPTDPLAPASSPAGTPLSGSPPAGSLPASAPAPGPTPTPAPAPTELVLVATGLAGLRRLDDLVGGLDLLPYGTGRLAAAVALPVAGRARRRALPLVAEARQLSGWLAADAGDTATALDAYRLALTAAAGAGDRSLAAHILGSASHLLASIGDPTGALLLARTGYVGARRTAAAGLRALLLHRIALAAALCGRRRTAQAALAAAERAAERREPVREPPWLYWLDEAELAAMSGRCLAALRRPLRAEPLLSAALHRTGQPRTSAIYGAWLARTYLELGEVEQAGEVADAALLDAVRAGSARAAAELAVVRRRLAPHRAEPAGRRHAALAATARPYLPVPRLAAPTSRSAAGAPAAPATGWSVY